MLLLSAACLVLHGVRTWACGEWLNYCGERRLKVVGRVASAPQRELPRGAGLVRGGEAHAVERSPEAALRARGARQSAGALAGAHPRDCVPERGGLRREE